MGPVTTFYLLAYADHEVWEAYEEAMSAALFLHGDGMLSSHKDAFKYGDAFGVLAARRGPRANRIKKFMDDVAADPKIPGKLGAIHSKVINNTFGGAVSLTADQKAKITGGKADEITDLLKAENGGIQPAYSIVTWVAACNP